MIDELNGGFHGKMDAHGNLVANAPKAVILNTRILWTFAKAGNQLATPIYQEIAERAFSYLQTYFLDPAHGGLFWQVDAAGKVLSDRKQVYAQAFGIYGFSEFHLLTQQPDSLTYAKGLFRLLEENAVDRTHNGYFEACARDWGPIADVRLSEKEPNVAKTMNTHLHVLEAYTNLYRVVPEQEVAERLGNLIRVMLDFFVNSETWHQYLFFDEQWRVQSQAISYGHDIEASWLLVEAAEVLGDEKLLAEVQTIAIEMAKATMLEGMDPEGGLWYERASLQGHLDSSKHWWPQAEAMVGFLLAYQLTEDPAYVEAMVSCWQYIETHLKDALHGEWHWGRDGAGKLMENQDKAGPWKAPYHNIRALLECVHRIEAILA